MDSLVEIALISLAGASISTISATLSPLLLAHLTGRQRAAERREDFARQDRVADAARSAVNQAKMAAQRSDATAQTMINKIDVVHTLVNSTLTGAKQSELEALIALARTLTRMAAGEEATAEDLASINSTAERVHALQVDLANRSATPPAERQTDANN